jgi:hypothetical protein
VGLSPRSSPNVWRRSFVDVCLPNVSRTFAERSPNFRRTRSFSEHTANVRQTYCEICVHGQKFVSIKKISVHGQKTCPCTYNISIDNFFMSADKKICITIIIEFKFQFYPINRRCQTFLLLGLENDREQETY